MSDNTTTGIVISQKRLEQLRQEASDKETSVSYIVNIAIKEYFEKKEKNE
jgi:hypothetical protein